MLRSAAACVALTLAAASCAGAQQGAGAAGADAPAAKTQSKEEHVPRQQRERAQQLFLDGARDMERGDVRAAIAAFDKAAGLDPGNRRYGPAAEVARQHLVEELIQQSDKDRILGHYDDARAAIEEAVRVDPRDPMIAQHADELTNDTLADAPEVRSDGDQLAAPIALEPKPGRRSFHVRTNARELIRQVLSAYGVQATLDDSVSAQTVRYDIDDVDFQQAEQALGLATDTFLVALDPGRALVAKDTKENRTKYEREAVETIYLPGMTAEELTDISSLARVVFSVDRATATPGQMALTVHAPVSEMSALNATLADLMAGRSELQLDVRMYEVDRTKAVNLGAILPNETTLFNVYSEASSILQSNSSLVQEIISSGLAAPGDWEAILAILIASGQLSNSIVTSPFGVFGGGLSMTGVEYSGGSLNMQLNSSDVRSVDQMQLRVLDREEAVIKAGERYPIETSSYSSLAGTSLGIAGLSSAGLSSTLQNLGVNPASLAEASTEAIPQVQYQDIGLTLDVTPRIESERSMSLKFDLKLSSLAGSSINGLPVLDSREYQAITSLSTGQSAVLVSTLSRQESDALTGLPGLSDIPGFQAMTNKDTSVDYSELAIVITPHLVRRAHQEFAERMHLLPHEP